MSSTQRLGVDALWIKETLGAVEGLLLKAPETLPEGTIDAILSDSRRAGEGKRKQRKYLDLPDSCRQSRMSRKKMRCLATGAEK